MEQAEGITVAVGVFSGRPNPEMTFVDEEAERVAEMLREAVQSSKTHAQPQPKLGEYHGFLISIAPQLATRYRIPAHASVFAGVVADPQSRSASGRRDVAGLERYLLEQAVRHELGDLLQQVGVDTSELDRPGSAD